MADIDLWVGGLSESLRLNGGVFGQTFSCLFAKQFLDLKRGDRFFYENAPNSALNTAKTAFSMGNVFIFKIFGINLIFFQFNRLNRSTK